MKENQEQYRSTEKANSAEAFQHIISQPERQKSPDRTAEISERDIENKTEKARRDVSEIVNNVEKKSKEPEKEQSQSATPTRRGSISKKQKNESYKRTIEQVQKELPIGSRTFSKIVHNRFVEKTSDALGATVARPNSMLAGAIFAFIITLVVYTIAKKSGYVLSGFETIGSFALGWIIGILYDYLHTLVTGKK